MDKNNIQNFTLKILFILAIVFFYTLPCVLIDFSLTIKAATLIFISGRGSAISSAKQGKSRSIFIIWLRFNKLFVPCKRTSISENLNRIHTCSV